MIGQIQLLTKGIILAKEQPEFDFFKIESNDQVLKTSKLKYQQKKLLIYLFIFDLAIN